MKQQMMEEMKERRYDIEVHGRVQGVGFRYAARNQARSYGLKGWVENRSDGSVFVVIQGEATSCNDFIGWCRQGPGYSWVERIEISERNPGPLKSFQIRH
ncbi:MAG: acylphosphatase [Bacteroidota bacterium]